MTQIEQVKQDYIWVDQQSEFDALCLRWQNEPYIALDTEFIRYASFYPEVALLQVADSCGVYLIDPFEIEHWQGFVALLESAVVKVFYAAEEDIELLHTQFNAKPVCIFDAQLALGFLGEDYPQGYQKMVLSVFDVELDKSSSRSDWKQRPLSDKQKSYAAGDVSYLYACYPLLIERLGQMKTSDVAGELFEALPSIFAHVDAMVEGFVEANFDLTFIRLKSYAKLSQAKLLRLQQLMIWREQAMRLLDMPRKKVASDDALLTLAMNGESQLSAIMKVEGLSKSLVKPIAREELDYQEAFTLSNWSQALVDDAHPQWFLLEQLIAILQLSSYETLPESLWVKILHAASPKRFTAVQGQIKQHLSVQAEKLGLPVMLLCPKPLMWQLTCFMLLQAGGVSKLDALSLENEQALAGMQQVIWRQSAWRAPFYRQCLQVLKPA